MKTSFRALALIFFLALSAWADAPPKVVILPLEMPGYYNPLDSEGLTKVLETNLHKLAPNAGLQVTRAADLSAFAYKAGAEQPPTPEMADKMCRAYGANYVCWVSIRFQPDFQASSGALALAGATRFWVYNADTRRVAIDQPLSLVRVGHVANVNDEKASRAAAVTLAEGCVADLASQIVAIAHQQTRPAANQVASWNPSADYVGKNGANYKAMVKAANDYQKAAKNNSLVDITTSQAAMSTAWTSLSKDERKAITDTYPGITELMTTQAVPSGYGYWPYR